MTAEVGGDNDPGYGETAKMLGDAALCLALDRDRVLVVERSFSAGVGNTVRVFLADLRTGDDATGLESMRPAIPAQMFRSGSVSFSARARCTTCRSSSTVERHSSQSVR